MEKDWKNFWQTHPLSFFETDFLGQVGKTLEGRPINSSQVESIIQSIRSNLNLKNEDILLDLCCGNGFITKNVASSCKKIDGIDHSSYLINIAKKYNCSNNINFICCSLFDLIKDNNILRKTYDKVLMYEALQFFQPSNLIKVLSIINKLTHSDSLILLGSVPDIKNKWDYYNTPERRKDYFTRYAEGNEAIGTWWDKSEIFFASELLGFSCIFQSQPENLHTAHYRFDAVLKKY